MDLGFLIEIGETLAYPEVVFVIYALILLKLKFSSQIRLQNDSMKLENSSTWGVSISLTCNWMLQGGFFILLSKSYSFGPLFLFISCGQEISLLLIGYFILPKLGTINKLSFTHLIAENYGGKVLAITKLANIVSSCGIISIQLFVCCLLIAAPCGITSYLNKVIIVTIISIAFLIYSTMNIFGKNALSFFKNIPIIQISGILFTLLTIVNFIPFMSLYYQNIVKDILQYTLYNINLDILINNFWFLSSVCFVYLFYYMIPNIFDPFFQQIILKEKVSNVKKAINRTIIQMIIMKLMISFVTMFIYIISKASTIPIHENNVLAFLIDMFSDRVGVPILYPILLIISCIIWNIVNRVELICALWERDIHYPVRKVSVSVKCSFFLLIFAATTYIKYSEFCFLERLIKCNLLLYVAVLPIFFLTLLGFRKSTKTALRSMLFGLLTYFLCIIFLPSSFNGVLTPLSILIGMLFNGLYFFAAPNKDGGIEKPKYLSTD
ncbi:MAG: hypothetical protein DGJ47_000995 [Rickettsiaceae bacterium]